MRQVQVGESGTSDCLAAYVLAEKLCSQLHAGLIGAATWASHTRICRLQHWTEQMRKLNSCAPARRHASALVSAVPSCLLVSLVYHFSTLQLEDARCSPVRSRPSGRSGLDFAANQRGHWSRWACKSTKWWHCIRQRRVRG